MLFEIINLVCNILEYHSIERSAHLVTARKLGSLSEIVRLEDQGARPIAIGIVDDPIQDVSS